MLTACQPKFDSESDLLKHDARVIYDQPQLELLDAVHNRNGEANHVRCEDYRLSKSEFSQLLEEIERMHEGVLTRISSALCVPLYREYSRPELVPSARVRVTWQLEVIGESSFEQRVLCDFYDDPICSDPRKYVSWPGGDEIRSIFNKPRYNIPLEEFERIRVALESVSVPPGLVISIIDGDTGILDGRSRLYGRVAGKYFLDYSNGLCAGGRYWLEKACLDGAMDCALERQFTGVTCN